MCGISLLVNTHDKPVLSELIQGMNDKVIHRGPDGEGYHFGEQFAMGHRRLAIIDLSDAGFQPMRKGDDHIIFNGMIYNYLELKEELISLGYTFHTQTDTEVLLTSCQHWGFDAFKKLNGMWAFAWHRASTNEIILCRDYYGIKPLYYSFVNGMFAAASEIKQFTSLPGFTPVLNKKAAINFLVNGSLNYSDNTFFSGVKELRSGNYLVYDLTKHQSTVRKWYDLSEVPEQKAVNLENALENVSQLFGDSVTKRMRSDVSLASCLSGGIDSSSIVSYIHAHKLAGPCFATVTSCYNNPKYDEQIYSDEVSRITRFRSIKVFPDLDQLFDIGDLDKMIYHQDQPFTGASHFSEFSVFKTARDHGFTVMLDGQGADEYLCGYDDFFTTYINQLLRRGRFKRTWQNIREKAAIQKCSVWTIIKTYAKTAFLYPVISSAKKLLGKTNYSWLSDAWKKKAEEYLVDFRADNVRDLALQQVITSSLPLQLHSEDRNSMMHSIESRLPFLDHRLVEYVTSLPAELKIRNGISKFIFREAIREIPTMIKKRAHKMGFVAPDEPWLRANVQNIRAELADAISNSDMYSDELLKRFDKFVDHKLNFEHIYFRVIALNRFIRIFKMETQTSKAVDKEAIRTTTIPGKKLVPEIVSKF